MQRIGFRALCLAALIFCAWLFLPDGGFEFSVPHTRDSRAVQSSKSFAPTIEREAPVSVKLLLLEAPAASAPPRVLRIVHKVQGLSLPVVGAARKTRAEQLLC